MTINRTQPMRPAEIDLLNQVDTNTADIATQTARLTQEIADRTNADNVLQKNIDTEAKARTDADTTLQQNINNEASARQNADDALQANINTEQTRAKSAENTLTTNLNSEIDRAKGAEQANATAISGETAARTNADNVLQQNINTEQTRAESAENTLTTNLNSEIDRAKKSEQANATAISGETAARTNADTGLQSSINEINAKFPVQTVNIGDAQVTVAKLEQTIKDQLTFMQSVPEQEFGTSNAIDVQANSNTSINIIFGRTKTKAPIVLCGLQSASGNLSCIVSGVTNQQFSVTVYNNSSTVVSGIIIDWLAISGR